MIISTLRSVLIILYGRRMFTLFYRVCWLSILCADYPFCVLIIYFVCWLSFMVGECLHYFRVCWLSILCADYPFCVLIIHFVCWLSKYIWTMVISTLFWAVFQMYTLGLPYYLYATDLRSHRNMHRMQRKFLKNALNTIYK